MKICYLFFLFAMSGLSGPLTVLAQKHAPPIPANAPRQTARTELFLDQSSSEVHMHTLPADSTVVLLIGRDIPLSNKSSFTFQQYDYALHLRQELPLEVPKEFDFTRMCAEGTTVYALFTSHSNPGRLWVAAYSGPLGQVRTQQFESKLSREVVELKALDGRLFATVLLTDQRHVTALLLDVATGQMQYLSSIYEPLPTQLTFVADAASRRAEYVLSQTNGRKSRLLLKQLTDHGQLVSSEFVQAESERGLISAQISPAADSTSGRLLAGTYTLRDPRYSQGLFAADLSAGVTANGSRRSLRFYDFANLKHFFDFMSPGRARRLRQKSEKLRAADRVLRLRYRTLIHDLIPFEDGYVMVAEIYFPYYRHNTYGGLYGPGYLYNPYYYSGYGNNNWSRGNRGFDGYRITHALVCGFDKRGNLLWDNTFVLKDVVRYSLSETVRLCVLPDGRRLAMAYLTDDKLNYKIIDRTAPSPNDLHVNLKTSSVPTAKEKATTTSNEGLVTWYGNRFLAYGYQHVRADHAPNREVFFLNSIGFE